MLIQRSLDTIIFIIQTDLLQMIQQLKPIYQLHRCIHLN